MTVAAFLSMLISTAALIFSMRVSRQSRALALRNEAAAQNAEAALKRAETAIQCDPHVR